MNRGRHKERYNKYTVLKLKKTFNSKKGVTLIELIVTFALISLFILLSTQVISSAMNVYYKIQSINYGRQVSDTLMDKIAGTISAAQVNIERVNIENEELNTKYTLQIEDDMSKIDLYNGSGSHIYITNTKPDTGGDKQLVIHYYRVESVLNDSNKKLVYEPIDWTFDKKMYLDYKITKLEFSLADPDGIIYPENVIRIHLEIDHKKFGSYSTTRYVECYNFQDKDDFEKIKGPGKAESGGETPTPDPPENSQTYPDTDIVVKNDYWPTAEDFADNENKIIVLKPGIIFKYSYGDVDKYYVMVGERDLNNWNYKTPADYIANGNNLEFELTGTIHEYSSDDDIKTNVKHGDLCIWGGEYYAYKGYDEEVKNPGIQPESWIKIVNDRIKDGPAIRTRE
ncbi:prepilin-type N-terminal cleavage/methylation domain-containing protein [Blautia pseudococcoides]|uniref:type II secretion system protein n=1 Tax=Blautia pseudococcoides TaxID=1796616 RepID=UPI00148B298D|nr:prepilin-type N-terminal cleavage/methylation domain-containing protein [Blautia pseudococcoides]QJU16325.1 prepilin-type N-terminal cleavage/methylation domain-containing protein [Blautia pseudococcoides]